MAHDGKKKLGKRDGAKDILEYRTEGYLPETMMNFLAFLGWNPGDDREIMSHDELVRDFDITRVQKSGAQFNDEKLDWMNREYLKKLSYEEQEEYIVSFLSDDTKNLPGYGSTLIHSLVPVIMERISIGENIRAMEKAGEFEYFFKKPDIEKEALFFKSSKIPPSTKYESLASYMEKLVSLLETVDDKNFSKENVKETLWSYAEEIGRGDILWPLRYSLSGKEKSPDPFILSEVLGKEETISRIKNAIQILKKS
jgi:glutamyl/glutaminyl-tRNA synthetase